MKHINKIMQDPNLATRKLLVQYLQELHNAKSQLVAHYANWAKYNYSDQFVCFLNEERENTCKQRADLEVLANILQANITDETQNSIGSLLHEAKKINYREEKKHAGAAKPNIAQLLQWAKHHEMLTGRGALMLALDLKENQVADKITKILKEDKQTYSQLKTFKLAENSISQKPTISE